MQERLYWGGIDRKAKDGAPILEIAVLLEVKMWFFIFISGGVWK